MQKAFFQFEAKNPADWINIAAHEVTGKNLLWYAGVSGLGAGQNKLAALKLINDRAVSQDD